MGSLVPVILPNGETIQVEVTRVADDDVGDVAGGSVDFDPASFKSVIGAIEGIAESMADAFRRICPDEATVEFGVELSAESGALTAVLVKGGGKASLKIALKWVASGGSSTPTTSAETPVGRIGPP